MFARRCSCVIVALVGASLAGCDTGDQSTNTSDSTPANASPPSKTVKAARPPKNPIDEESHDWTLAEALANLEEPELGLSAAVRLVRLADVHVPMLPDPLPVDAARKLRLTALSDSAYALGVRDDDNERVVRTPLLIDLEGKVSTPGDEGESFDLYVSRDGDVFPHLLIGSTMVMNAASPDEEQIRLKSTGSMRFEVRQENGVDYLALIHLGGAEENGENEEAADDETDGLSAVSGPDADENAGGANDESGENGDHPQDGEPAVAQVKASEMGEAAVVGPVEVARYQWDLFESMFMGPAADKLPAPLKGRFELDLEASAWLQPVGGEIGDPDAISPPGAEDEDEWD